MRILSLLVPVLLVALAGGGMAHARSYDRDQAKAQRACLDGFLRQERVEARAFGQPTEVLNDRGERVGEVITLQVPSRSSMVVCRYDYASGRVQIDARPWGVGKADAGDRDKDRAPSLTTTREACERAVRRRDYRIERVRSQADVLDNRRRPVARLVAIDARRDGRDWRVNCTYDFRTKDTKLEVLRR